MRGNLHLMIRDGVLYEAILTAVYEGKPYAAPVGFIKSDDIVRVKVYRGGLLSKVVSSCSVVVLNFTYKPEYFIRTAFKGNLMGAGPQPLFNPIDSGAVSLRDCFGYIVVERAKLSELGELIIADYRVRSSVLNDYVELEPYTRCYSHLVELAVIASKIRAIKSAPVLSDLLLKFEWSMDVINKTCGDDYKALARHMQVFTQRCLEEK
ncbi:MAG: DUF447 family protein [Desulfurococcaceae archaeon]